MIILEPTSSSQLECGVVEPSMQASSNSNKQIASRKRRSRPRAATHELDLSTMAMNKHEDNIQLLLPPMLNATLDSPYHTETIKTSAKIADMKTIKRTNTAAQLRRQQQDDASIMIRSRLAAETHHDDHDHDHDQTSHHHCQLAESSEHLIATSSVSRHRRPFSTRAPWRPSQTMSTLRVPHRHRTPLLNVTAMSLVTLLLVVAASLDCLTTFVSSSSSSSDVLTTPVSTTAEALVGSKPVNLVAENGGGQQNVIVIKYANVTSNSNEATGSSVVPEASKLNVYQLYNEPLSYSVMQSKFSQSLQLFDVSHNQLSALAKDLFCPLSSEVQLLNISHNLLENFDCLGLISKEGQVCLMYLRTLDMSYNLIKHVPDAGVASLHNLEVLDLSHNLIETLEEISLSTLFRLTRLDLSHNRIQQLPMRIFHKSSTMQVLKLQSNMLQNNINQMLMSGLTSLEELNLSHNNISHVSELAFLDKRNLTRVDLSHNSLSGLRQDALRVTVSGMTNVKSQQQPSYKPRLHHNGEYAGLAQVNLRSNNEQAAKSAAAMASVEFHLSSNPFVCDCQLDWMRKFQPAMKRSVLTSSTTGRFQHQLLADSYDGSSSSSSYQSDQPVASVIQQQQPSNTATGAADPSSSATSSNNISENVQSNSQQQSSSSTYQQATISSSQQQQQQPYYGRIADLDLIKCSPLFRRNSHLKQHGGRHHHSRAGAPSDGAHHNLAVQVHHANNHLHHPSSSSSHQLQMHHSKSLETMAHHQSSNMIDLVTADSSNFLCRYKSHCFALCHCCEFDACDCEMICPAGCNCYYDSKWETNIIDCSSNNHTVVPDRIPMDVSGLYLDGNNIDSLKPSNLIARKSLRTLYLNGSNLQYIANRTFNGLIELQTLYLNDNMLRTLNGYEFEPLAQLRALYLQSNRLDHINNQTFNNLRSLEVLDLSNNRLTSMNLDLFGYIAHYNIRLRQLSLAHNWWSCQCNSINSFRHLLRQKFLVNGGVNTGGVNIVDRNQLRCYYNSTTVGPLILDSSVASSSSSSSSSSSAIAQQQPIFGSFGNSLPSSGNNRQQQQQQQLTEINQCSDMIDDGSLRHGDLDVNPPMIFPAPMPVDAYPVGSTQQQQQPDSPYDPTPMNPPLPPPYYPPSTYETGPHTMAGSPSEQPWGPSRAPPASNQPTSAGPASAAVSLTSFVVALVLFVCIFVVVISIFVFIRQQQRAYGHHHHKKSSAASTTSVSSSASSTAISSSAAAAVAAQRHHQLHHGGAATGKFHHHNQQLPQPPHFGTHTLQQQQHLLMGQQQQQQQHHANNGSQVMPRAHQHHHHSASSQSNIYAALVPPTNNGGSSTIVTNIHHHQQGIFSSNNSNNNNSGNGNANNNLYSNSSTTASHHSSSNSSQHNGQSAAAAAAGRHTQANWMQQSIYGSQMHQHQLYAEAPYAVNASVASYKTGTSLYNAAGQVLPPAVPLPGVEYRSGAATTQAIGLPKQLRHFMSKLVNKSLALGGYRPSSSRDELANITSDKIYDAFLSYDKRDEPFVMQYLSAELEYGSPQYRVADRYRDLPLPSSAYIAEAITSVIGCSHRTIIVLTENYLSSEWCRYELQAALRESALDKSHKLIAVVLDPKCLQDMDSELRNLLLAATGNSSLTSGPNGGGGQIYQAPLVQLADGGSSSPSDYFQQQQLVTSLANPSGAASGGNQQICTQTAGARLTFINYNERKFWSSLKQLMPLARPSAQTLTTLTTKN